MTMQTLSTKAEAIALIDFATEQCHKTSKAIKLTDCWLVIIYA